MIKILIHVQDSRYSGIRPSHFSGIQMVLDAMGIIDLEYIDMHEDGYFAPQGQVRHADFDAFIAAHPGEEIWLLDPDGDELDTLPAGAWLCVGPAGGFSQEHKDGCPKVKLNLANPIEARDALMMALGKI